MKKTGKTFYCQTCDKDFYRSGWQIKRNPQKFCSLTCRRHTLEARKNMSKALMGRTAWNKGTKGVMKSNSGSFKIGHDKGVRFGRDKSSKGEHHANWKGGITPLVQKVRLSQPMKLWRTTILERDGYTCQSCGQIGGRLQVDHVVPFSEIWARYNIKTLKQAIRCVELWDTLNGRTLCVPCHKETDTYLYKAKNNLHYVHI